jgi:hypothetical protein
VLLSAPVDCVPVRPLAPFQAPPAVQALAFAEDQLIVELLPLVMALGPTLSVTVGAADVTLTVVDCEAVPPGPMQVKP